MRSLLVLTFFTQMLSAQQPAAPQGPPPAPITDQSIFRRLELPTATTIRAGSGAPGRDYWQQRVDYVIKASLDTLAQTVSGEERITYRNNSPDTLRYLWLQVDQNIFSRTSRGSLLYPPDGPFGGADAEGGFRLSRLAQPALPAAVGRRAEKAADLVYAVNGTMLRVELPNPLPPKSSYVFDVAWSFPFGLNANRMGMEKIDGSTVFEAAQWYPRLAVYDDIRGWNTEQYLGLGEFYLEYGRFDVSLTLPANMLVGATGVLQNPLQVLTQIERGRLGIARSSDTAIAIRSIFEVDQPSSRPASPSGSLTWHFLADSVRDFAWAAASHFVWQAVGVNGGKTLAMTFYPPSADSIWNQAAAYGKSAIERYSRQWYPYPYPVAVNINGVEGGMEYPMIVFCHNRTSPQALYSVTDHEFGHTWFPMVVGSNERLYPWMDEGFNTFINYYNWRQQYPDTPNRRGNNDSYLRVALSGAELPIMTPADRQGDILGLAAYNKPGLALRLLRDEVVGADRFDPVFREYIRRWAYKHPSPADFFRTMEDGLGEDLSWYWREWFYTTDLLDQSVDSVGVETDSSGAVKSRIYLRSVQPMVMPVTLDLMLDDGSTERLKLPVEIWYLGSSYTAIVPGPRKVTSVTVDPDSALPDINRANDKWPRLEP